MDSSGYRHIADSFSKIETIGNKALIPLDENTKLAAFSIVDDENFEFAVQLFNFLAQLFKNELDFGFIDDQATTENLIGLQEGITNSEVVLFVFLVPPETLDNEETLIKINKIVELLSEGKKRIAMFFTKNYIPDELNFPLIITLPTVDLPSLAAGVMFLVGRKPYVN